MTATWHIAIPPAVPPYWRAAPVFDVKFTETGGDDASLRVTLAGGGLVRLDEVTFTILDEAGKEH